MGTIEWLVIGSVAVVVVAGAFIAAWWWKLVSHVAPYRDELEKAEQKRRAAEAADANTVVIPRSHLSGGGEGGARRDGR